MRIAIAVEGTRGDVYPVLALAETLAAAGHSVRVIAPPDFEQVVEERGLEFWSLGMNVRAFLTESAAALHSRGPRFLREMNRWGKQSIEIQFRELPEATRGMDRLLAAGTILAASTAAELHDIRFRYLMYTPAMLPSADHSPALLPCQFESPRVNRVLWWMVRALTNNGVLGRQVNRMRAGLGLTRLRDVLAHVLSERPIVAVDRPLAPVPEDCPFEYDQIRCLHPLRGEPLPAKLESFLQSGPPPVYLGFGSMTDPDPRNTTRRLIEAIDALGCRALIARGWAGLGDGALPEGVMAIDPVSHATLFPRTAAVVHHGGAGTTHSAARAGVPQVIVPHVLDQFYFARRVAALGIGPPALPRTRMSVERLCAMLRATLDNEFVAERAAALARELAALGPEQIDPALVVGESA